MNLKFNILPEKIFPVTEYNNMILSYTMFGGMKFSFNQACIDSEIIILTKVYYNIFTYKINIIILEYKPEIIILLV